jgi:hypothetical protein
VLFPIPVGATLESLRNLFAEVDGDEGFREFDAGNR